MYVYKKAQQTDALRTMCIIIYVPHFVAFSLLRVVVDVVRPLLGVPGQVPVPVTGVELAP